MWSFGVILYFFLGGYLPFHDRDQLRLYRTIKAGIFRFDPKYWGSISDEAKDLIRKLLTVHREKRLTAAEALKHPWMLRTDADLLSNNLETNLEQLKLFSVRRKLHRKLRVVIKMELASKILQGFCSGEIHRLRPTSTDFNSTYQLGDILGGEGSSVRKATMKRPGANFGLVVAVKCVDRTSLPLAEKEDLFEEARISSSLEHPNVIRLYDFFEDDPKTYFLAMGDVFDYFVKKGCLNEKEARSLFRTVLEAVRYCHDRGIVHRDLKPESLLLTSEHEDAIVKLSGFHFARSINTGLVSTQVGTPHYVAPEILRAEAHGTEVDMWGMGVILFIFLSGEYPFHDEDQQRLFSKIKAGDYKFHPKPWGSVSHIAKDLIARLLRVDPRKRLTAAQALSHPWLLPSCGEKPIIVEQQLNTSEARRKLRGAIKTVREWNTGPDGVRTRVLKNGTALCLVGWRLKGCRGCFLCFPCVQCLVLAAPPTQASRPRILQV